MNILFKIVVKLKWIQIKEKHILYWLRTENKDLLLFSLKEAPFQIRLKTIDAIVSLKNEKDIPHLLEVSINDYESEVLQIERNWIQKTEQKKNRVVSKKSNKRFDKNRMQALENLKQQLKRPMSGGKWF